MDQQQHVLLSVDIPILDWGKRKRLLEMGRANRGLVQAEVNQEQYNFIQEVSLQTISLNQLPRLVKQAEKTEKLAKDRYLITRERFLLGNIDLMKLNASLESRSQARKTYISIAEKTYWENFYALRSLTLYDFEQNMPIVIEEDFDEEIVK